MLSSNPCAILTADSKSYRRSLSNRLTLSSFQYFLRFFVVHEEPVENTPVCMFPVTRNIFMGPENHSFLSLRQRAERNAVYLFPEGVEIHIGRTPAIGMRGCEAGTVGVAKKVGQFINECLSVQYGGHIESVCFYQALHSILFAEQPNQAAEHELEIVFTFDICPGQKQVEVVAHQGVSEEADRILQSADGKRVDPVNIVFLIPEQDTVLQMAHGKLISASFPGKRVFKNSHFFRKVSINEAVSSTCGKNKNRVGGKRK